MAKKLSPVAAAVASIATPEPVVTPVVPATPAEQAATPEPAVHVTPAAFTFEDSGFRMGRAKLAEGRLLAELCEHLRGADFAAWGKARADFLAGAHTAGYLSDDIWDKAMAAGRAQGLIGDKPKTPDVDNAKRDERRKAHDAQIAALTQGKTVAQLASEVETRAKEFGKVSAGVVVAAQALDAAKTDAAKVKASEALAKAQASAKASQDAMRVAQEARDTAAKSASAAAIKAASERITTLRNTLRGLIGGATEAELIAAIKCIKVKAQPVKV
jgi:hypothetical protein